MLYKKSALFLVLTYTSEENFANLRNHILIFSVWILLLHINVWTLKDVNPTTFTINRVCAVSSLQSNKSTIFFLYTYILQQKQLGDYSS